MSRKRICEDCGNKCNDEYCPICGRKTKVYNEASRQEDTLYDAAKYRTTADTKKRRVVCLKKRRSASMTVSV